MSMRILALAGTAGLVLLAGPRLPASAGEAARFGPPRGHWHGAPAQLGPRPFYLAACPVDEYFLSYYG